MSECLRRRRKIDWFLISMKRALYTLEGGNPKGRFWDDVVTYWNFDEFIEIYIHITHNKAEVF